MKLRFSVVLFFIVTAVTLSAGKVIENRGNYQIVIPDKPSAVQKCAAEELKNFLKEIFTKPVNLNG